MPTTAEVLASADRWIRAVTDLEVAQFAVVAAVEACHPSDLPANVLEALQRVEAAQAVIDSISAERALSVPGGTVMPLDS